MRANAKRLRCGRRLSGSIGYRMHFESSQLPPVLAFWSVTAYEEGGYFIANPINRYAIGDRDKLRFKDPGPDRESNWLPCGANGTRHPPALVRVP
jgi:hypothetical protein